MLTVPDWPMPFFTNDTPPTSLLKRAFRLSLLVLGFFIFSDTLLAQSPLVPVESSRIKGINVFGKTVDDQTRCIHWHSQLDVIAIKFKCCNAYYPCFSCHAEAADHAHEVWPRDEFDTKAILCGVCGNELAISTYMESNNSCPTCEAAFNPGCSKHYHLYFETDPLSP